MYNQMQALLTDNDDGTPDKHKIKYITIMIRRRKSKSYKESKAFDSNCLCLSDRGNLYNCSGEAD